ncbi:hypothetical protein QGM71_07390 [Virgibacillus sp. C22-A2]|uniref:YknX-like alpha-helical hairpin domain-containing protein n=1 Tax=Virgibacillus tibetensis TaxID=3042313 RepID=A0ABU6KDB3_9BACI|nr:hypothetical protein [Virgibacillus sp. C22-A2]
MDIQRRNDVIHEKEKELAITIGSKEATKAIEEEHEQNMFKQRLTEIELE